MRRTSTCAWRAWPRCSWPCVFRRRLSCATTRWTAARSCSGPLGSARSSSLSGRDGGSFSVRSIWPRSSSRRSSASKRRSASRGSPSRRGSSSGSSRRRLDAQAQRPADALHVDADHARALALAPERRDRQPREVAHERLRRPPAGRPRSGGAAPRGRPRCRLRRPSRSPRSIPCSCTPSRSAAASVARKKKRSNTSSKMRRSSWDFANVAASASRKPSGSVHGTSASTANASSSSAVPLLTPSARSSSPNSTSRAARPGGMPRSMSSAGAMARS